MNAMDQELSRIVQESLEQLPAASADAPSEGAGLGDEEFARMARAFVFSFERRPASYGGSRD